MHITSTVNPNTSSSGDVNILLLFRETSRVFVVKPRTYEKLEKIAREEFSIAENTPVFFETSTLDICQGHNVRVRKDAYGAMWQCLDALSVVTPATAQQQQQQQRNVPAAVSEPVQQTPEVGGAQLPQPGRSPHGGMLIDTAPATPAGTRNALPTPDATVLSLASFRGNSRSDSVIPRAGAALSRYEKDEPIDDNDEPEDELVREDEEEAQSPDENMDLELDEEEAVNEGRHSASMAVDDDPEEPDYDDRHSLFFEEEEEDDDASEHAEEQVKTEPASPTPEEDNDEEEEEADVSNMVTRPTLAKQESLDDQAWQEARASVESPNVTRPSSRQKSRAPVGPTSSIRSIESGYDDYAPGLRNLRSPGSRFKQLTSPLSPTISHVYPPSSISRTIEATLSSSSSSEAHQPRVPPTLEDFTPRASPAKLKNSTQSSSIPLPPADGNAKPSKERFCITIIHPSTQQSAMFKTRGGHYIRKILTTACSQFQLDDSKATLVRREPTGNHSYDPQDTVAKCGLSEGAELYIILDDDDRSSIADSPLIRSS